MHARGRNIIIVFIMLLLLQQRRRRKGLNIPLLRVIIIIMKLIKGKINAKYSRTQKAWNIHARYRYFFFNRKILFALLRRETLWYVATQYRFAFITFLTKFSIFRPRVVCMKYNIFQLHTRFFFVHYYSVYRDNSKKKKKKDDFG